MWKFVKTALFGGLGILLPILLLVIVLKEFVELLIALATPIADLLPEKLIESVSETEVLAALLIVAASLILGLLSMIPFAIPGGYLESHPALVLAGPIAMALFFRFSCWLMDVRSLERRPEYQRVVDEVSAMIPWFPKARSAA